MNNVPTPPLDGSAWEFFLYIKNHTSHTLFVESPKIDWGIWYRDSMDDNSPIEIKPGESIQALGIRASKGTATGYECRCRWSHKEKRLIEGKEQEITIYSLDFKIDVPYSSDNSTSLTTTGGIHVEGWEGIGKKGHNFTRSIVISELGRAVDQQTYSERLMDTEEKAFCDLTMSNNQMIQDWSKLEAGLKEITTFIPSQELPKEYHYPPSEFFVGRTKKIVIPRSLWQNIDDPIYKWNWQKNDYVNEYFSVAVYSYNTNPRDTVNVPKGVSVVTETSVEVSSSIRNSLETTMSIRTLLRGEYSGLTSELEATYSRTSVMEDTNSRVERSTRTISIETSKNNRIFVPWVFSTAIAVYRKTIRGETTLIGLSEWADEIFDQVYEY